MRLTPGFLQAGEDCIRAGQESLQFAGPENGFLIRLALDARLVVVGEGATPAADCVERLELHASEAECHVFELGCGEAAVHLAVVARSLLRERQAVAEIQSGSQVFLHHERLVDAQSAGEIDRRPRCGDGQRTRIWIVLKDVVVFHRRFAGRAWRVRRLDLDGVEIHLRLTLPRTVHDQSADHGGCDQNRRPDAEDERFDYGMVSKQHQAESADTEDQASTHDKLSEGHDVNLPFAERGLLESS